MCETTDLRAKALHLLSGNETFISNENNGGFEYIVMPSWDNPRWFIPNDTRVVSKIGNIVKPTQFKARIAWTIARILNKLGMFGLMFRDKQYIKADVLGSKYLKNVDKSKNYVVYTGAKGVYQKFTIQEMKNGEILSFTKVGCLPLACQRVKAEADALRLLQNRTDINVNAPVLMDFYEIDGMSFLKQSPCERQYNQVIHSFTKQHRCFLEQLDKIRQDVNAQDYFSKISDALLGLEEVDPIITNILPYLKSAKDIVEKHFSETEYISMSLSHGDFNPWNCFSNGSEIFVYDWEMSKYRFRLWDYFNFVYHKAALRPDFDNTGLKKDLEQNKNWAIEHIGEEYPILELVYLIDITIHYIKQLVELNNINQINCVPDLIQKFSNQLIIKLNQYNN